MTTCKVCRFSKEIQVPGQQSATACCRFPPTVNSVVLPQPQQPTPSNPSGVGFVVGQQTIFPVVGADGWCGEYAPKPSPLVGLKA